MPKCKNIVCGSKFEKVRANQVVCSPSCAYQYTKQLKEKKEKKAWRERKKRISEEIKSRSQHLKELQVIFNSYIRERDKLKGCVSCQKPFTQKYDAGHYRSVGSCPELRFNEDNVHGQCVFCNQHKHGNLIEYRKGLIRRIGLEKVYDLETQHQPKKYTIENIKAMKEYYKRAIKALNK